MAIFNSYLKLPECTKATKDHIIELHIKPQPVCEKPQMHLGNIKLNVKHGLNMG